MQRYVSKSVVCPFYHNEGELTLYCEGVVEEATLLISFRELKEKTAYKERCCCSLEGYKRCPVAEMLLRKYGEKPTARRAP